MSEKLTRAERKRRARAQRLRLKEEGAWYPKGFWPSFAAPATAWMILFFITPFYAVFALAFGTIDPFWRDAIPVWNPLQWNSSSFQETLQKIVIPADMISLALLVVAAFGIYYLARSKNKFRFVYMAVIVIAWIVSWHFIHDAMTAPEAAIYRPAFVRTFMYVIIASSSCLLLGYPVAYFVARYGGKYKSIYLVLLIAPFWISYMMRMLAWVNILQPDGYLNELLSIFAPGKITYGWLEGHWFTLILGIVYGYVPYMILPLYAGLDRISESLLEASRDLGADGRRTFFRITLPLSKPAILAGFVIITLPMMGDYYTKDLLSRRPTTTMIGNLIDQSVARPTGKGEAAALVLVLAMILLIPMAYYMRTTTKETERW